MRLPTFILLQILISLGCNAETHDGSSITAEFHEQLAARWGRAVGTQNVEMMGELMADDYVWHLRSGDVIGFENVRTRFAALFKAFPDFQLVPVDTVSDGKKLVVRWNVSGTHLGEFLGVSPTGNRIAFPTISIDRISNGQFAEGWEVTDELGLRKQLGFILEFPK